MCIFLRLFAQIYNGGVITLTVCLAGKDGLVLASDSRGTFGDPRGITAQNDTITKIHILGNVGVAIAGAEQAHLLLEEVVKSASNPATSTAAPAPPVQPDSQQTPAPQQPQTSSQVTSIHNITVSQMMEKIREISRNKFNDWYRMFPISPNPMQPITRPIIQFTVVGYDKEEDTYVPKLYTLLSNADFAPDLHTYGFVLGGIANYALYLLNRLYDKNMKIDKLKHLAAYVITETATQDGKVGGPVQIALIQPNEKPIKLSERQVNMIIKKNEKINRRLKNIFTSD